MTLIAIDPGANGGFAVECENDKVVCIKMPKKPEDILYTLREISIRNQGMQAIVERVGTYMPGNSGPAAATFAEHVGGLKMALIATGIPTTFVAPVTWIRGIGVPSKLDKQVRKNAIKQAMQRRYPDTKVTLWNADALGILTWAKENMDKIGG